jgi:transcriptional regulator with XRE-family HTH domain
MPRERIWSALGAVLKRLREARGLSQTAVVESLGLKDDRYLRRIESGEIRLSRQKLIDWLLVGVQEQSDQAVNHVLRLGNYAELAPSELRRQFAETTTGRPHTGVIHVWWPEPGVAISGQQPFKALIPTMPLTDYRMYWRSANSPESHEMADARDARNPFADHKEALMDIPAAFQEPGPQAVTFVAHTLNGELIAEETIYFIVVQHW